MRKMQIDKLLDASVGQHGYWLINNIEYVRDDLEFLLTWHQGSVKGATTHLDDLDSDFTKKLYAKIDQRRAQVSA